MSLLDELLARTGKTRMDLHPRSRLALAANTAGVIDSPEVQRVLSLPRRGQLTPAVTDHMTAALALRPTVRLRPLQAEALCELVSNRGLLAPIGVGEGKTLLSALAATVLGARRPLLLIPASLRQKTLADFDALRRDWRIAEPEIRSYEGLGRADRATDLDDLAPDLIIADEAHRLRNPSAAVTRRVARYIRAHRPVVALLSGTLLHSQLLQIWHFLQMTHAPEKAPIPASRKEAEHWARAIDDNALSTLPPGALAVLGESQPELRAGYGELVRRSPGVVASEAVDVAASIRLRVESSPLPYEIKDAIAILNATHCRPDGVELFEAEQANCELELALGFWYGWRVQPPPAWTVARRNWHRLVRDVLAQQLPGLDSPLQVAQRYQQTTPEGQAWSEIGPSFVPERRTVWITYEIVDRLLESCREPTIIWTPYQAVGERLRAKGLRYFAKQQADQDGFPLRDAVPGTTIACSISACHTGANLQAWSDNLVLAPPADALIWEQLIGRTHRSGQLADEVLVRVHAPTHRARERLTNATVDATVVQQLLGQAQRLCIADRE